MLQLQPTPLESEMKTLPTSSHLSLWWLEGLVDLNMTAGSQKNMLAYTN